MGRIKGADYFVFFYNYKDEADSFGKSHLDFSCTGFLSGKLRYSESTRRLVIIYSDSVQI